MNKVLLHAYSITMEDAKTNDVVSAVEDFLKQWEEEHPTDEGRDIFALEMFDCIKAIKGKDKDALKALRNIKRIDDVSVGTLDECYTENKDAYVFSIPGANKYCRAPTNEHAQEVIKRTNHYNEGYGVKKVCIKIMLREDSPFCMSFEYTGEEIDKLKNVLLEIFPKATVSIDRGDVTISELVDDYKDYMRKYSTLLKHKKIEPFASDIHILHLEFPEGVEHGVSFVRINTDIGVKMLQPIINIYDNRHYGDNIYNTIKDSSGCTIALRDVISATGVKEKDMNIDYLTWISANPPMNGEKRSSYLKRIKEKVPSFNRSYQYHNKIMKALGWKMKNVSGRLQCWTAE